MINEKSTVAIIIIITTLISIVVNVYGLGASYNTEQDCRTCHGNDTANRHHMLAVQGVYNCINCHPVNWNTVTQSFEVNITRDCLVCHVDKNHTEIHHIKFAATGLYQCQDCHRTLYNADTGQYYTELITDCPVCHNTTNGKVVFPWTINQTPTPTPIPTPGQTTITSWGNNKTYNDSLSLTINVGESVNFNVTADQPIDIWNWYLDEINQNNNYDNFTIFWTASGTITIKANATNINGASNTVIWNVKVLDPTNPFAPTGLHNAISCDTCHPNGYAQIPQEDICYQCHNDSRNSYNGINITYQFTIRNDSFGGMGTSYYNKVNTRHDISDQDQINSSTKLECTNCHSTHNASRQNITIDPDTGENFNKTMIHPGTKENVSDSVTFCLKCHDNTWPSNLTWTSNVIGPSIIMNITSVYMDASNKGDEHGLGSGRNNSRLIGPYNGTPSSNVPPMPCTDCHDSHGGKGIYHLKTLTDQYGKNITITSDNINNHTVAHWCSNCHFNPMNQLDGTRGNCLKSGCHIHGKKF